MERCTNGMHRAASFSHSCVLTEHAAREAASLSGIDSGSPRGYKEAASAANRLHPYKRPGGGVGVLPVSTLFVGEPLSISLSKKSKIQGKLRNIPRASRNLTRPWQPGATPCKALKHNEKERQRRTIGFLCSIKQHPSPHSEPLPSIQLTLASNCRTSRSGGEPTNWRSAEGTIRVQAQLEERTDLLLLTPPPLQRVRGARPEMSPHPPHSLALVAHMTHADILVAEGAFEHNVLTL